jgi:hypothetical protein
VQKYGLGRSNTPFKAALEHLAMGWHTLSKDRRVTRIFKQVWLDTLKVSKNHPIPAYKNTYLPFLYNYVFIYECNYIKT